MRIVQNANVTKSSESCETLYRAAILCRDGLHGDGGSGKLVREEAND